MNQLPLKLPLMAEFFTRISYVKDEPTIEIVPVAMPNWQMAIAIGENPDSDLEGKIKLADERGEIFGVGIKQLGFESSIKIAAAYEHLRRTHDAEFERFLTAATHAAIEEQWSQFPMSFPVNS
jgi:hypothetical protein